MDKPGKAPMDRAIFVLFAALALLTMIAIGMRVWQLVQA